MKNILALILLFISNLSFANEIYDANWCTKNGGTPEFEHDVSFNCITNEFNTPTYIEKIYNSLVLPLYSAIIENRRPEFLIVTSDLEKYSNSILDNFNYRAAQSELARYI